MRKSFYENYMGMSKTANAEKTFSQERQDLEEKAVAFEMKRKAQADNFPKVEVSTESHPGHKTLMTDEHNIVEKASKHLKTEIGKLVGRGGFTIDVDEFRSVKAHNDKIDDSNVTDTAYIGFDVNFTLPGDKVTKVARFAVSFDGNRDESFKLEDKFLDSNDKDYVLSSKNLQDFLMEKEVMKTAKTEKPIVWFNPEIGETGTFEAVKASVANDKTIARLVGEGFEVDSNFYVDACYGPKEFGRLCHLIAVPMNKTADFKRICAMSDEEWINRGLEKTWKQPTVEWVDRALEKKSGDSFGYGSKWDNPDVKKTYKDNQDWMDRTEEKQSDANPYTGSLGMLKDDCLKPELRKEAVKKALAEKIPETASTLEKLNKLDDLLK